MTWSNIYDLAAPKDARHNYDLTAALQGQRYDALKIVKTAENLYTSLGFAPLPATFWQRSMFTRPRDREVDCHASAWNIDGKDDVRVKACLRVTDDDFYTAHHELGHNFYQRAYKEQSILFQDGANDGFHEAIGDFVALSAVSPSYLKAIGLIDLVPDDNADIPFLLRMALDRIAFLPFAYIVDKWRWQNFAGEFAPERYNESGGNCAPNSGRHAAGAAPGRCVRCRGEIMCRKARPRYFVAASAIPVPSRSLRMAGWTDT
jgi:peptidyl-dipeptidase A